MKTGKLIRELRIKKGITQEDLASCTKLTTRTIQRIENGDVDPRAYTLKMIANALDVDIRLFTEVDSEEKEEAIRENKRNWLVLLHLSGLFLLVFPTAIIWNKQKDKIEGITHHYRDIINFQLGNLVLLIIPGLISLLFAGKPYFIYMIIILSGVTSIMNSIKVLNSQPYKYFYLFKFRRKKKETQVSYK